MNPADLRKGDDPATWRGVDVSGLGTVVVERLVGTHGVVQVDNQIPIGSSPGKSGIRGTRGMAVPCGLIRPSSGVGGRCSSADWSWARNSDRSKCRNG